MAKTRRTNTAPPTEKIIVERVQTGVRLEKRLLKVLKGLAAYHDMTLGDLLAGITSGKSGRNEYVDEGRRVYRALRELHASR